MSDEPEDFFEQQSPESPGQIDRGAAVSVESRARQSRPLGTVALLLVMGVVYVGALPPDAQDVYWLLRQGGNYGPLIFAGDYWRLVSSIFLHHGVLHLVVNAYSLLVVGPLVERRLGLVPFVVVFLVSGAVGALTSVVHHPDVASVGASGALFGLLGALLVHEWRAPKDSDGGRIWQLSLMTLLANVVLGSFVPNLDYAAHLGGLVGGTLCCAGLTRVSLAQRILVPLWLAGTTVMGIAGYCLWMIHLENSGTRVLVRAVATPDAACRFQLPAHYMVKAVGEDCVTSPDGQGLIVVRSLPGGLASTGVPTVADFNAHPTRWRALIGQFLRANGLGPTAVMRVVRKGIHTYLEIPYDTPLKPGLALSADQKRDVIYIRVMPQRVVLVVTRNRILNDRLEQGLNVILNTLTTANGVTKRPA